MPWIHTRRVSASSSPLGLHLPSWQARPRLIEHCRRGCFACRIGLGRTLCRSVLLAFLAVVVSACGDGEASSESFYPTSAACSTLRDVPGSDIVVMLGQSNMAGAGAYAVEGFDTTDPRILQWGRTDSAVLASEPLQNPDPVDRRGRIGPGLAFARVYLKSLPPQRNVLLVPAARGGTSFSGRHWNPGDSLYVDAVRRTQLALKSNASGNCIAAFLWSQGESDVDVLTSSAYASALDKMIQGLRADLPAQAGALTAPFLLSQFSPEWLLPAPTTGQKAILDAINATPSRRPYTAVVPTTGLRSNLTQGLALDIHLDAASQRVMGQRFYDALPKALTNAPAL